MFGGGARLFAPRRAFERRAIHAFRFDFSKAPSATTGISCPASSARARKARDRFKLARAVNQWRFIPKRVRIEKGHRQGLGIAKYLALKEFRLCARGVASAADSSSEHWKSVGGRPLGLDSYALEG